MTIATINNPCIQLDGNGLRDFPINFRVFERGGNGADTNLYTVKVYLWSGNPTEEPIVQIQNTDFTVTQISGEVATIRFTNPVPVGTKVLIFSDVPYTQFISPISIDDKLPDKIETADDRIVMMIKQLLCCCSRALKLPLTSDLEITIDPTAVADGKILEFQAVPNEPNHFVVSSSIDKVDLADKLKQILDAVALAQTLATQAQASANNAQVSANNAQTSATQASDAYNQIVQIKSYLDGLNTQIQQFVNTEKLAILAIKTETELLKQQAEASATSAQASATSAQASADLATQKANLLPDPTGLALGTGIVADGMDNWITKMLPYVENFDTATTGSNIKLLVDNTGHRVLIADSMFTADTQSISATDPILEGGTDQSQINQGFLSVIQKVVSAFKSPPFTQSELIAYFLPRLDGSLFDLIGKTVTDPTNIKDVIPVVLDGIQHYASASFFPFLANINNQQVFSNPLTILFAFRPTGASTDVVLLDKSDLQIKFVAPNILRITYLTGTVDANLIPNVFNVVTISITDTELSGYILYDNAGTIATSATIPTQTLANPITSENFIFGGQTDSRFIELLLVRKLVDQADAIYYAKSVLQIAIDSGVPDPVGVPAGQTPVTTGSAYNLKYLGLILDNIPQGYTVDNTIDVGTTMSTAGRYQIVAVRDDVNNKIEVKIMPEEVEDTGIETFVVTISATTPTLLIGENLDRSSVKIQNRLDLDIYVGTLTALTANKKNGSLLASGASEYFTGVTAWYALVEGTADSVTGEIGIREQILRPRP